MQFQNEVKQAIRQLPPAERVVAIALKKIYEQITKLYEKQKQQIDHSRLQYIDKYKSIQDASSGIIAGRIIAQGQLANVGQYFVEEERKDMKNMLESPIAPLKDYWLTVLKNSFLSSSLSQLDNKILPNLSSISSTLTQKTIQLTLTFSTPQLVTLTRTLQLSNGMPVNYKGNQLKDVPSIVLAPSPSPAPQGLLADLFTDTVDQTALLSKLEIITAIVNQIVPNSLRYYLGQIYDEEEDEDDESENEEEEEGEQNGKGNQNGRKVKN